MTDQKHLPPRGEAPCPNCSYEAAPPPRTEAGKRLRQHLLGVHQAGYIGGTTWERIDRGILDIEAEAPPLDGLDADLRTAIEIMDMKATPYGESEDGSVVNYIVRASTWHRVLAIARGSTSAAARRAIDDFRALLSDPTQTPEKVAVILLALRDEGETT